MQAPDDELKHKFELRLQYAHRFAETYIRINLFSRGVEALVHIAAARGLRAHASYFWLSLQRGLY